MSIPSQMLEADNDLKTLCQQCKKEPGRFIYWGLEIIVCSERCAELANDDVDRYFKEHPQEPNDEPLFQEEGTSAADSSVDSTWPDQPNGH